MTIRRLPHELLVLLVALVLLLLGIATSAQAYRDYEIGTGIGFVSGSPDGTNFAQSFQLDWRVARERTSKLGRLSTSIGPYVQFVPPGSYMQIAGAIVGRLRWHFLDRVRVRAHCDACQVINIINTLKNDLVLSPFAGMGGIHAQLSNEAGNTAQDFSYYTVVGISLDYDLMRRVGASLSFAHNFHDLNMGNGAGQDRGSDAFFFSVRIKL